jgi:hypothetical protein
MTDLEQRIRELPLCGPSSALDERLAELFAARRVRPRPDRTTWRVLAGTALAAGLAGFAAGVGLGQWTSTPQPPQGEFTAGPSREEPSFGASAATYVLVSDSRIGSGLDFSRSVEPFRVQPISQEGS